jgi:hypothetical protein
VSYPKDLDEYTDEQLREELERREKATESGLCGYCGRLPTEPACKFPERHEAPLGALNWTVKKHGGRLKDPWRDLCAGVSESVARTMYESGVRIMRQGTLELVRGSTVIERHSRAKPSVFATKTTPKPVSRLI